VDGRRELFVQWCVQRFVPDLVLVLAISRWQLRQMLTLPTCWQTERRPCDFALHRSPWAVDDDARVRPESPETI
jgi:hypothetical protein